MAAGGEFVDGWLVAQVLGEGAYGEVRLLVHSCSGAAVALKAGGGAREAALHRALRHPHVLRCLGAREHLGQRYMFLEYAQGGELFDRIEPDVGMEERAARRYWRQVLAGLGYLHGRGVAHRDIKPENLLLDHRDNVKISDFGMATVFRHGERERLVTSVCGTPPYAAPEVLAAGGGQGQGRPYRAPPADLWSAAVVLVAMLTGELPWDRASESDPRFASWAAWVSCEGHPLPPPPAPGPWRRAAPAARSLLRVALHPCPARRAPLDALLRHKWLAPAPEEECRVWHSQPTRGGGGGDGEASGEGPMCADVQALVSRSQPSRADDLLLASQSDCTQHTQHTQPSVVQRLMRRMTRVWVRGDEAAAVEALQKALAACGMAWRRAGGGGGALDVLCGGEVRMRAWAARALRPPAPAPALTLLEFRRSRGCGMHFKRRFVQLRQALRPVTATPPPQEEFA